MEYDVLTTHNNPTTSRALIVSDDAVMQRVLQRTLWQANWNVEVCGSREDWLSSASQSNWLFIAICVNDDCLRALNILEELQDQISAGRSFVVVIAKRPSIHDAIVCIQLGATDYLAWPVLPAQVIEIAERARRQDQYELENEYRSAVEINLAGVKHQKQTERTMIGGSAAMIEFSKQIVRIARTPGMRAFITGETGTGKEVVARTIHEISRCSGPFRAVNCAATVEGLLESDLFGHEKGAFTGAHATKKGFWEEATGGTLFLDEITEASLAVQAKLLRALQEGLIRRVGSNQEIKVTARVIAASNKDVQKAVKDGTFRQDLYYRLGQVLRLPPLRERREDIPPLVDHFRRRAMKETVFTPESLDALCDYDWPGNVRELESVIQRIIAFSGRFVFREDVLRHIKIEEDRDDTARKSLFAFWDTIHSFKRGDWPTMVELRDWYVQQAYCYLGKESAVARRLGLDVRTVNAILRKEANQLE
jgi:two-component system NtrC family response regulator